MRVYIGTDLEGISGVIVWEQTRDRSSSQYQEARRLLMGDVSAAVEGCLEGGATDVVVGDGHGGGFNFAPELMHPGARYLTGQSRPPWSQRAPLYGGYDAGILLGYHAMAGTADGILRHTQSSRSGNQYWYNDRESGEIAQSSLLLGHFGTPVVMVTGDSAACREASEFLGDDVVTVSVKEGYSAEYGLLMAPEAAHEKIREGAGQAMGKVGQCQPYAVELPIRGRLRFPDKSTADGFSPTRSQRVDDYSFEATFDSALEIYEF
ncbi:M55 family metallopeptidase [Candidatus Latescibacterota bacterium]